jgi:flavorubredoxin
LFIEKFGSLTADQDRVESETESQLNEVTKEHEEIESDYFNFFMEHCTKKYKGIIEKYESNHGRIVRENFNDFLRKSYYEMLEVNIAKDISFGAMVTTED